MSLDEQLLTDYYSYRENGQGNFCNAPSKAMYFRRDGVINACGWNVSHILGKYPEQTLKEAWESVSSNDLRMRMAANDLSSGCQTCENYLKGRNFANIKSTHYDDLSSDGHSFPRRMDFALDNVCNLECVTCFGELSSSIRKNREKLPPLKSVYDEKFVQQLKTFIPYLETANFMGGEPFLIPIYYDIWEQFAQLNASAPLSVTTNGTVLNNRVKNILSRCNFNITVSLDSTDPEKNATIRKGTRTTGHLENIHFFNNHVQKSNKMLGINALLSSLNWMDLPDVVRFCNDINAKLFVCSVMFPYPYSIRSMSQKQLGKAVELIDHQVAVLPNESTAEEMNRNALSGVANHLRATMEDSVQPEDPAEKNVQELKEFVLRRLSEHTEGLTVDRNSILQKFTDVFDHLQARNAGNFKKFLTNAIACDLDLLFSRILWQEEEHLRDYLPYYVSSVEQVAERSM